MKWSRSGKRQKKKKTLVETIRRASAVSRRAAAGKRHGPELFYRGQRRFPRSCFAAVRRRPFPSSFHPPPTTTRPPRRKKLVRPVPELFYRRRGGRESRRNGCHKARGGNGYRPFTDKFPGTTDTRARHRRLCCSSPARARCKRRPAVPLIPYRALGPLALSSNLPAIRPARRALTFTRLSFTGVYSGATGEIFSGGREGYNIYTIHIH